MNRPWTHFDPLTSIKDNTPQCSRISVSCSWMCLSIRRIDWWVTGSSGRLVSCYVGPSSRINFLSPAILVRALLSLSPPVVVLCYCYLFVKTVCSPPCLLLLTTVAPGKVGPILTHNWSVDKCPFEPWMGTSLHAAWSHSRTLTPTTCISFSDLLWKRELSMC